MKKHLWVLSVSVLCAVLCSGFAEANVAVRVTREVLEETLKKAAVQSGRELAEHTTKKAAMETLERLTVSYGDDVLKLVREGGLELVEGAAKYGDDVVEMALKSSPAAGQALVRNLPELLPLARRVGLEALELEARSSGMAVQVFKVFGDDMGKVVAKNIPAEDLPRLLKYAEKADSPATRELLLNAYKKEKGDLFKRIPPSLVLATGVTASMIYGTHRATEPMSAAGDAIRENENLAVEVVQHAYDRVAYIVLAVIVLLLWRFRLMPWHGGKKPPSSPRLGGTPKRS